ncbi:hypothetical protein F9B85_10640 [Heliorestis acidaminivorans]|uniref:NusG-like N-terminal domain-containing protein n=1 Tax=Heliorestis acidaminivorans TaxID=553427 RepID=A0A6I0EZC7_9FIRM|nr:transcription termination/antitermination NusG family protein [Heliorestis acidaminivorans]KAB2952005.1 hypothetical protein F9B85_10640 [Heliorestis acidaminivorans]
MQLHLVSRAENNVDWYACRVMTGQEKAVASLIAGIAKENQALGIVTVNSICKKALQTGRRARVVVEPIMPGYIMISLASTTDPNNINSFLKHVKKIPGFIRVSPVPLPEKDVSLYLCLSQKVHHEFKVERNTIPHIGDWIFLTEKETGIGKLRGQVIKIQKEVLALTVWVEVPTAIGKIVLQGQSA